MSTLSLSMKDHIERLKEYQAPESPDNVNKIYFLEVEEKTSIKVGDTERGVEERNRETMTNAGLHRKEGTCAFYVVAEKFDGTTFRDKQFHKFLRKQGYTFERNNQGNESEWVESDANGNTPTVEQLLTELEKFINRPVYQAFEKTLAQHYLMQHFYDAIDAGCQHILLDACMRSRKTTLTLSLAKENDQMPVYIGKNLTSQASAEKDNERFGLVPEMCTVSLHGATQLDKSSITKKAKQIIKSIDRANTKHRNVCFVVDEVDDASHTKQSRKIINKVIKHYKKKGQFGCAIAMSGTRIHRGMKVLLGLTTRENIREITLSYFEMQILQPEETVRRNYRHISYYSENAVGLTNISDSMKSSTGRKSIATCIVNLLGTNDYELVVDHEHPHWYMKICARGKNNANELVKYLNRNCSVVEGREVVYAVINGDVTSNREAEEYCNKIIAEHPEKICVFITQGMATTSFSVPGIGNAVVFTDNEITADDTQALHRSATWVPGKTDCNMIVITTNGSTEYFFDDIFEKETRMAKSREDKIALYKELLHHNSMIHFHQAHGFAPVRVTQDNADDVIDRKMKSMTRVTSFVSILSDMDQDLQERIYETVLGKSSTSQKARTEKPGSIDPFGKGETEKDDHITKKTTGLTEAKKEKSLRAFAEKAALVPALAREQETTIEEFDFWDEIGLSKDLFFDVYNTESKSFKDRIDTIYNLCDDDEYLVNTYIQHLTV